MWKDLRSGMACNLFSQGWHVEDINLRLGHSPQSNWLKSYINYLAINRKRAVKQHYQNNLTDIKEQFEEVKQRDKGKEVRIEELQKENKSLQADIEDMKKQIGNVNKFLEKLNKGIS